MTHVNNKTAVRSNACARLSSNCLLLEMRDVESNFKRKNERILRGAVVVFLF